MPIRVHINVQGTRRYIEAEKQFWDTAGNEALEWFQTKGVEILQKHVPKGKTMKLHDMCKAEVSGKTVRIFSEAKSAEHIDGEGKTEASPGRYVPAIGKRLVTTKITPKQAIIKRAARKHIPGRLPKGLKIKFKKKVLIPYGPRKGEEVLGIYNPKTREIQVATKPRFGGLARRRARAYEVEKVLTHELWHAVQHAETLPFKEREAREVERSLERKIGMHPGSKKTPFGRMAAEELRAEAEEWVRKKIKERQR